MIIVVLLTFIFIRDCIETNLLSVKGANIVRYN